MRHWARRLIEAKPTHKIKNFIFRMKMCKCSILTAIASGYAGRDPQGGFCYRSVHNSLLKSLWRQNESSSLFLRNKKMKKNYVKVRKKTVEWEGGKEWRMTIYKEMGKKATMYKWVGKEVIWKIWCWWFNLQKWKKRNKNNYLHSFHQKLTLNLQLRCYLEVEAINA